MKTLVAIALGLVPVHAHADPVAPRPAPSIEAKSGVEAAFAVNAPLRWVDGASVALSGYIGFAKHHAIRANVAHYDYTAGLGVLVLDAEEPIRRGDITDVGVGWTYFPDELWSGFTIEAGVLRRARDIYRQDDFASPEIVETDTTTYAGRVMVGWSYYAFGRVFLAAAVGGSTGLEIGRETTTRDELAAPEMRETRDVSRKDVSFESYLRIGVTMQ